MKRQTILIGMIMLCFAWGTYGQTKQKTPVTLFAIDTKRVTVDEFVYLYKKNHQGKPEEFTKQKVEEYLDLYIKFKLKVIEAESRGMDSPDAFLKELNSYKEELKKPYIAETNMLDRLVKEAYDRLKQEVKASHILIAVKPDAVPNDTLKAYTKANEIRTRLVEGEDFEKLAKQFSEDPSVKVNGGNLGYFSALQMVFPFEEVAYHLPFGEVSNPVRTKFGYHLIKVEDKRSSMGEVEVSHILVRGEDEQAKNSIFEVYKQLEEKEDWNKLCSRYSQDPGTKDQGGKLKPFGTGALASAPLFEEVAFSMTEPGSISKPLQTSFGWHIIRLERKIPLPPFSELEQSLKRRVARDDRMVISKSVEVQKRKIKMNYREDSLLSERLSLIADSSLVKGEWAIDKVPANGSALLFSMDGVRYHVKELADFIEKNQSSTNVAPSVYLQQLYDRFVEEVLAEREDMKLQYENPEYKELVNEYREGILLFSIMEKEVWNKASEDSLGQRNHYERNLGKYTANVRLEARLFSTTNKAFLDSIKVKIVSGDTLRTDDLKRFKSVVNYRAYERGDNRAIDSINWTIGLHEAETDGIYYLVEVSRLVPPGQKKFEEVRASVISDYQDYLEKEWITNLKNKYNIKVSTKGKKKAFAELTLKENANTKY